MIKQFEEYLSLGIAKKISPDLQRAKNLKIESERKYSLLKIQISSMNINDNNANDYVEYCYNIIMFLIRAKMFEDGYSSSGPGAHEAEVSYARELGLKDSEIRLLDQLRYFRNGILYYGKRFDKEYAEKIIKFTDDVYARLIK